MKIVYGSRDSKLSEPRHARHVMATYTETGRNCPLTCRYHPDGIDANKCYTMGYPIIQHALVNGGIQHGRLLASVQSMLTDRRHGVAYATAITVCRHHVSGDVIDPATGEPDELYIAEIVEVNHLLIAAGIDILGYTHAWHSPLCEPLKPWFMASCDSIEEVRMARRMGWITCTQTPDDSDTPPDDVHLVKCPNQITAGRIKCLQCLLCSPHRLRHDTTRVIVFDDSMEKRK